MYRPPRRKESGIAGKVALLRDGILHGKVAAERERYHMVGVESEVREPDRFCVRICPSRASIHNSGHNAKWLKDS
jgi:hypothetical protein